MAKKHTADDDIFVAQFSAQLRVAYELARSNGTTRTQFANSLGVGSTALQDFLDGKSMPSVRSLALAVHEYDIDVTYGGTSFRAHRSNLVLSSEEQQLTFPFVLSALDPRVALKLGPVTDNTVTLGIYVKRTG
jgi:transcriptional regulator with XRE-family HTH domain